MEDAIALMCRQNGSRLGYLAGMGALLALHLLAGCASAPPPVLSGPPPLIAEQLIEQGEYKEAIARAEAELAALEAAGSAKLELAEARERLARAHRLGGDQGLAQSLQREALAVFQAELGAGDPRTAEARAVLAEILYGAHELDEAYTLAKVAYEVQLARLGELDARTADAASVLADILSARGELEDGFALYEQTLAIRREVLDPNHPDIASAINDVATYHANRRDYVLAQTLYQEALAIDIAAYGRAHPATSTRLFNIGINLWRMGRLSEAEQYFTECLEIRERVFGDAHFRTANVLVQLASIYRNQGRLQEAEPLLLRAIAIREAVYGPDHVGVAFALNALGLVYSDAGRAADSARVLERALDLRERHIETPSRAVNVTRNNLAISYRQLGRLDEARVLMEAALADAQRLYEPGDLRLGYRYRGLAHSMMDAGEPAEAERLFAAALAVFEAKGEVAHHDTASVLSGIAVLNVRRGDLATAAAMLERAEPLLAATLGLQSSEAISTRFRLARLLMLRGDAERAIEVASAALEGLEHRLSRAATIDPMAVDEEGASLAAAPGSLTDTLIGAALTVPDRRGEARAAAFRAAQIAQSSHVGAAAKLAAIITETGGEVGEWMRERRDLLYQKGLAERRFLAASGRDLDAAAGYRVQIVELEAQIMERTDALREAAPHVLDLVSAQTLPADALQHRFLETGQGLLLSVLVDAEDALIVFLVTPDGLAVHRAEISRDELGALVERLRASVDLGGAAFVADLPEFDAAASQTLYDLLVAPFAAELAGLDLLYVVSDGPLGRIPFSLLSTSSAEGEDRRRWLIDAAAVAHLPSVVSLAALKSTGTPRRNDQKRFLGIGDPLLEGEAHGSDLRTFSTLRAGLRDGAGRPLAALNAAAVCQLAPLPETRRELQAIGAMFGADEDDFLLGSAANEPALASLSTRGELRSYDVIAFATHGLLAGMAGESDVQPALVLSPPPGCTAAQTGHDGLLTAGEVSALQLAAEWVILSACSTAAGDPAAGGEPLSGLAKAFFHAGARALLVSHWDIDSAATGDFMVELIAARASGLSTPAALREVQLRFRDAPPEGDAHYAHPAFWAPFAHIGAAD